MRSPWILSRPPRLHSESAARIGEAPGVRDRLSVYGDDYDTPHGTGIRGDIRAMGLGEAHLADLALKGMGPGCEAPNHGTGQGYSVLEIVRAREAASGRDIPFVVTDRRRGDVAVSVTDTARAKARMGRHAAGRPDDMRRYAWA